MPEPEHRDPWDALLRRTTEWLKDDPVFHREAMLELRSHLEEKCAELEAAGHSPEESRSLTEQAWGDPEQLGNSLFIANHRRLKMKAKVKLAVKVLLIPVLLAGLWCSVNVGNLAALSWLWDMHSLEKPFLVGQANRLFRIFLTPSESWDATAKLSEPIKRVQAIQKEYLNTPPQHRLARLEPLLRQSMEQEPANAFYNYFLADLLLDDQAGYDLEARVTLPKPEHYRRAVAEIQAGLRKPYCKSYGHELAYAQLNHRRFAHTPQGLLQRILIYEAHVRPYGVHSRTLSAVIGNQGTRIKVEAPAKFTPEDWVVFMRQINDDSTDWFIYQYVVHGMLVTQRQSWLDQGHSELAALLPDTPALGTDYQEKQQERRDETTRTGGLFTPAFGSFFPEATAGELDMEPERRISYYLMDDAALALFMLVSLALMTLAALVLLRGLLRYRQFGHYVALDRAGYLRLLGYGVALPLALYFCLTGIDFLSGRAWSPYYPGSGCRFAVGALYLAVLMPLWFVVLAALEWRKKLRLLEWPQRQRYLSFAVNLIPAMAIFLLLVAGVLRWNISEGVRREMGNDRLFFASKLDPFPYETKLADRLQAEHREALQKLDKVLRKQ